MGKKMIGLPPGTTQTLAALTVNAARAGNIFGDRLAQFGQALRRAVVGPAFVERFLARVDNMLRSGKIGFADFEMDDVASLRFERAGTHQYIESGFGTDPRHSLSQFHNYLERTK